MSIGSEGNLWSHHDRSSSLDLDLCVTIEHTSESKGGVCEESLLVLCTSTLRTFQHAFLQA